MKQFLSILCIALLVCVSNIQTTNAQPAGNNMTVLILGPTVSGGAGSNEALAASGLGYTVEVVSAAQWLAKSSADFATYRAVILGDPTCVGNTGPIAAAESSTGIWGPSIDGNVIINGTDAVFHQGQGGLQLTNSSIAFVLADDPFKTKTGAYISLSCYYTNACVPTLIPVLDAVTIPGSCTMIGDCVLGCYNNIHIVATHPALSGLTDATISNWNCSLHEAFVTWDSLNYQVLAIARDIASNYTAPDGSQGIPYILARGATVISDITLGPAIDTNQIGDPHTVTANVTVGGVPQVGVTVTFTVISGPCAGGLGTSVTDALGNASKTYTCLTPGTDVIKATFTNSLGVVQTSNLVRKVWEDNPLPVEMSAFTSAVSQNDVTLNWTTSSEENNSSFSVERSLASGQWATVGSVAGSGNTTAPRSYSFTDRNVSSGRYSYRLKQIDFNGNFEYFTLNNEVNVGTPDNFKLAQNYPNPFNPSTKIDFELPNDGNVTLSIYDNSGKLVSTLVDGFKSAGYFTSTFSAAGLSSGVYFYKLDYKSGEKSFVKVLKMSLLK